MNLAPLFRLYQPNVNDYFYTTSEEEKSNAIRNLGFKDQGISCYVFAKEESNTSPLYRLYKPDPYAHLYTRNAAERDKALHDFGFKDEGIACYVYETRQAGTFPFYRLFRNTSHLYTLSETEYNNDLGNGWTNEGIACYAYAFNANKMVRLKKAAAYAYNLNISLSGTALAGTKEILFDTGSWTLSVPSSWVNQEQITVLQRNIEDPWGKPANLVKGQICLTSEDDNTVYSMDDYEFYEVTSADASTILGAFWGKNPHAGQPDSLPYLLAQKYPAESAKGFGVYSLSGDDIATGWTESAFYLGFGPAYTVAAADLLWRNDLPTQNGFFSPQYVPGFTIAMHFDNNEILTYPNRVATVDTGAPSLSLRFEGDPQKRLQFLNYFTERNVPPWSRSMGVFAIIENQGIVVQFIDTSGRSKQYEFRSTNQSPEIAPTNLFGGPSDGSFPWAVDGTLFPSNRINLGNTIYFFCPIFYVDFTNEQVGILFKN